MHVARIDERMASLIEDLKDLKEVQKTHREESNLFLRDISEKVGTQNKSIEQYRNDRMWVIGIFGTLYAGLLAWVKSKVGA